MINLVLLDRPLYISPLFLSWKEENAFYAFWKYKRLKKDNEIGMKY